MSNLPKVERETILDYNQQDPDARIMTYDPALQRKLDKLCAEYPDEIEMFLEVGESKNYKFPKKWFKVKPPRKMSDEQKAAAAERLKNARAKKVSE